MIERMTRRGFARVMVGAGVAAAAGPALASEEVATSGSTALRRISGLRAQDWREHFPSLGKGAILAVIDDRVLHFWAEDGFYRIYPTSVPLSEEMTRKGRTEIVMKRPAPDWSPTPSMIERNPDLPRYVGPGPENPLGVRAMNLSWQYYVIHGTNDIRKIGRQSSSGCIGLHNEHVIEIYDRAKVGTQVLVV
ncbi:MAG TPA: L,D-transpeptidase [Amaricoccus sp.]|nr:L,D-transpeptidase [Amaricoccus sp.]